MLRLSSYVHDRFVEGTGPGQTLRSPVDGAEVAWADAEGVDRGAALAYAREVGGRSLRALTFAQRGELLAALSRSVHGLRDELLDLSRASYGATRGDGKFDVDGASGTLAHYAALGAKLGPRSVLLDGEADPVGRSSRFVGQHLWVPRAGVAVHVDAFNFPAWGMAEKLAACLLAGMPALVKPAVATSPVAWRVVRAWSEQGLLPPGVLSLLVGPVGDLLDHLGPQDVVAFTGSSDTGRTIRGHRRVVELGVPVNVEADSLNAAVLGPDVGPGEPTFEMFLADVVRDLTQKAGQKCTATRRIVVPEALLDAVREGITDLLGRARTGDPDARDTVVGPVSTAQQLRDVNAGVAVLAGTAEVFVASADPLPEGGCWVRPQVFLARGGVDAPFVHDHEVFGPVAAVVPWGGDAATAAAIVARGGGTLVTSLYTDDEAFAAEVIAGIAPWTGRIYWGSRKVADQGVGPGTVLPGFVHGGPGKAGGGQELGGLRGLALYQQRLAVQGDRALLDRVLGADPAGPVGRPAS